MSKLIRKNYILDGSIKKYKKETIVYPMENMRIDTKVEDVNPVIIPDEGKVGELIDNKIKTIISPKSIYPSTKAILKEGKGIKLKDDDTNNTITIENTDKGSGWVTFTGFQKIPTIHKNDVYLQQVCKIPFDMTYKKPHIDFNYEVQAQLVQDGLDKDKLEHYSARWKCYFSAFYDGTNKKTLGVYVGDGGLDVTTVYGINETDSKQFYFEVYTAVTSHTSDHYDWWEFFGGTPGAKTVTVTQDMIYVPTDGTAPKKATKPTYVIPASRYNVADNYQAIHQLELIKVDDSPGNVLGTFNGTLATETALKKRLNVNMSNGDADTKMFINNVVKQNVHKEKYADLQTTKKDIIEAINELHSVGPKPPTKDNVYPINKTMITAGSNVTIIPDDTNKTLTISSKGGGGTSFTPTQENIYPAVAPMLKEGTDIAIQVDKDKKDITINSTYEPTKQGLYPSVTDILQAGTNITITKNDNLDQLTIAASDTIGANKDLSNISNDGKQVMMDEAQKEIQTGTFNKLETISKNIIDAINELLKKTQINSFEGSFSTKQAEDEFMSIRGQTKDSEFENEDKVTSIKLGEAQIIKENFMAAVPLTNIELPVAIEVEETAFNNAPAKVVKMLSMIRIDNNAFKNAIPTELVLPELEAMGKGNFENAPLTYLDLSKIQNSSQVETVFNKLVNDSTTTFICSGFMGFNANMAKIFPNGWDKITVKPVSNGYTGAWSSKDVAVQFMQVSDNVADNEFKNEKSINGIALPHVKNIGKEAFLGLTSLPDNLYLPKCVEIGFNAFNGISQGLETLTLPKVTKIDDGAFGATTSIEYLVAPKLTDVGANAFKHTLLKELDLPEAITISESAFQDSEMVSLNLPKVTSIGGLAFSKATMKTLDLPEVLTIGDEAFENNTTLNTLTLPKVTEIGTYAFTSAVITKLDLSHVTKIGDGAFDTCPLTELNISSLTKNGLAPKVTETIFGKIVNANTTTVTMKLDMNMKEIKEHLFGAGNYDSINFKFVT